MDIFETLSSILMLISSIFGISCAVIFIIIVVFRRQCHTTTILLVLNSILAGFISNTVCGSQAIYQLRGDGNDTFCILRGYLLYSSTGLLYHTLCIQSLHRFFVTVLVARRYLRSKKVILIVVAIQWLISSCFVLPILLAGRITYNSGSRICLISINDPYGFLYIGTWVYFFSMSVIILLYILILRHMKVNSYSTNVPRRIAEQRRQRREIRRYCRILLLIGVLFIMGVPYCIFFLLSMINGSSPAPSFADRVCFLSISMGYGVSTLLSLLYTNGVRKIIVRFLCGERPNPRGRRVQCITTINMRPVRTNIITNT